MSEFGPEYPKINGVFKRDMDRKGVIIPWNYSVPEFGYLAGLPWRWTEKIDGTNIRIHWNGERVTVGGRTDKADVPVKLLLALQSLYSADLWRANFPDADDVTLYGEGYGAGIQKGEAYRYDQGFILFDVRIGHWWLKPDDVESVADRMNLDPVPCFGNRSLSSILTECFAGDFPFDSGFPGVCVPEGVVGTPSVPLFDRAGRRIITKVKVKDFEDYRRMAA